jgi:hypothetical protein
MEDISDPNLLPQMSRERHAKKAEALCFAQVLVGGVRRAEAPAHFHAVDRNVLAYGWHMQPHQKPRLREDLRDG